MPRTAGRDAEPGNRRSRLSRLGFWAERAETAHREKPMALDLLFRRVGGLEPLAGRKGEETMKLQEALLCVDCESLYSFSSHCPECGSQVSYPLGRALNRPAPTTAFLVGGVSREASLRSRTVGALGDRTLTLLQSA